MDTPLPRPPVLSSAELIQEINTHGLADLGVESYVDPDEAAANFIVRLKLRNGREFLLDQEVRVQPQVNVLLVQENVEGDLVPRFFLEKSRSEIAGC